MILVNGLFTPDGTYIQSDHRHAYVTHLDLVTNKVYMVDGGTSYYRSSNHGDEKFVRLDDTSPIEEIREYFNWGTYGKNGDQPFKRVKLKDMSNAHLQAIVDDGYVLSSVMLKELKYRKKNNIVIED